jgi:hypothetical protein
MLGLVSSKAFFTGGKRKALYQKHFQTALRMDALRLLTLLVASSIA